MEYPSSEGNLILPEYGRHVQQMVNHAITIEDREERSRCVRSIVTIMGNMFPHLRDVNDFKHKLWDHVAIMSDFKLDIDFPYEIVDPGKLNAPPDRVPYPANKMRYVHYGSTLEKMIERVADYEEGEERNELIRLIANQMKKCFQSWNKEVVDNRKIFTDLKELSKGKIDLDEENFKLSEPRENYYNNSQNKKYNYKQRKK
ncbi:MAG: DUF4290 domain-containing protein [Bacteroidales bacterium]|mgnify:CR=1 FL=1|jgi:hypothetical protein|nr:MAG: DUF4290 domain-containing protein [Paludibacter sp.]MCE1156022.1 DUF4290 domain-containing protein [Bacteroidales bacterium]OJX90634.1 MAG: hypothetical protein BGP01_04440 [Paludibacter sp. 47-17]